MSASSGTHVSQTTSIAISAEENRRKQRFVGPIIAIGVIVLLFAVAGLTNSSFLTDTNIMSILRSAAITGIVALGATLITISGRFFSLALTQTAVFSSLMFAVFLNAGLPFVLAVLFTAVLAALWGVGQGLIISIGANPIITTLGASALLAATSGIITNGQSIRVTDEISAFIGSARPLGMPLQTWTFLILIIAALIAMRYGRLGRATVLTGSNRATAAASGVSIWQVTVAAFVIASLCAVIAGVFGASQFGQARISEFPGLDFDVVAAVLVGGTAIKGGSGSPLRTALGAIFIATVQNYMLLLGFSYGVRTVVLGALVLVAVVLFHLLEKRRPGGAR